MAYSYDRRTAGKWDSSVLGLKPSTIEAMDADERVEVMVDALNRAVDLVEAVAGAFDKDLGSNLTVVQNAGKDLKRIARKY